MTAELWLIAAAYLLLAVWILQAALGGIDAC